jgi:hypothetical protein
MVRAPLVQLPLPVDVRLLLALLVRTVIMLILSVFRVLEPHPCLTETIAAQDKPPIALVPRLFSRTMNVAQDKPPIALVPHLFSRTMNAVQESHLIALGRAHLFSRMVSVDLHVLPEQTDNPVAAMVHHQEPTLDQTKRLTLHQHPWTWTTTGIWTWWLGMATTSWCI